MKYRFFVFSFLALLFLFSYKNIHDVDAQTTTISSVFYKSLKLGDTHPQVLSLQKILNTDPQTKVTDFGPGSPGNETSYFGPATKKAVIAFQNKYRSEILTPVGLSQGTGLVGPSTVKKLNNLNTVSTSVTIPNPVSSAFPSTQPLLNSNLKEPTISPMVYGTIPSQMQAGKTIVISGRNFSLTDNTVYIGDYTFSHLSSPDISTIIVTLPKDMTVGAYPVKVVNKIGPSVSKYPMLIKVVDVVDLPVITSVVPTLASLTDVVTVKGSGFTATDNSIYTALGSITGLSSPDGKTLTFTLSQLSGIAKVATIRANMTKGSLLQTQNSGIYVGFNIINQKGQTETPGKLILK